MAFGSSRIPPLRLPPLPKGYKSFQKWTAAAIRRLGAASGRAIQIDGAEAMSVDVDGSIRAVVGAGGTAAEVIHPFYILADGTLHAGTVNGSTIPTLGGSPIGETGSAISLSGDMYVYICNVWSLTFSSTTFFLTAASLSSSTITTSTTPLVDDTSLGSGTLTTYQLVAQVIGGVVQRQQPTHTNVSNLVCDASSGIDGGQAVHSNWSSA